MFTSSLGVPCCITACPEETSKSPGVPEKLFHEGISEREPSGYSKSSIIGSV